MTQWPDGRVESRSGSAGEGSFGGGPGGFGLDEDLDNQLSSSLNELDNLNN